MADGAPCALHLKGSFAQVSSLRRLQRYPDPAAAVAVERVEVLNARDGYVFVRVTVRPRDPAGDPCRELLAAVLGLQSAATAAPDHRVAAGKEE